MARVSIRDVAARAGVSTMTVSRVLRGEGSSRYYEQVMAAVKELDYVPVRSAVQNRHVKTHTLGVLLDGAFVFGSYFGYQTFAGILKAAFESGYDVTLLRPKRNSSLEEQKSQVLDRRCDGFIFVVPQNRPELLELLVKNDFPVVACYSNDVPAGVYTIVPDNATAMHQAVELLHRQGHSKIAFWSIGRLHSDARERSEGYENAMRSLGLEPFDYSAAPANNKGPGQPGEGQQVSPDGQIIPDDGWTNGIAGVSTASGWKTAPRNPLQMDKGLETLLNRGITAVVCHNDDRALALWQSAIDRGLRVPEDLSIIGIDDVPTAATMGLTTFANPFHRMGEEAVATLLASLQGRALPEHCMRFPMNLVERKSVAPPKSSR